MKKGLIRTVEVFLAIHILAMFLASIPIVTTPQYEDPHNIKRLQKTSEDLAMSICNHELHRQTIIEEDKIPENLEEGLKGGLPNDLESGIKLYDEEGNVIPEENGFPEEKGVGTTSCMITSHTQNSTSSSDEETINDNLTSGESQTVEFTGIEPGYENILTIRANQTGDGETQVLVKNGTEEVEAGTMSFPEGDPKEERTLNLTNYLPDSDNEYKITIDPDVETSYDYAELEVTRINPYYDPYEVVVGVWNR